MPCAGGAQRVRGKIKLPRQFIPPLPPLNELSDETSHPPLNRLEKHFLRLTAGFSGSRAFRSKCSTAETTTFCLGCRMRDNVCSLKRHFRLTSMGENLMINSGVTLFQRTFCCTPLLEIATTTQQSYDQPMHTPTKQLRFARHLVPAARLIKKLVLFDVQTVFLRSGCQRIRGITAVVLFEAIKGEGGSREGREGDKLPKKFNFTLPVLSCRPHRAVPRYFSEKNPSASPTPVETKTPTAVEKPNAVSPLPYASTITPTGGAKPHASWNNMRPRHEGCDKGVVLPYHHSKTVSTRDTTFFGRRTSPASVVITTSPSSRPTRVPSNTR